MQDVVQSTNNLALRTDGVVINIEVKHKQFGFFSAVPAADSTH